MAVASAAMATVVKRVNCIFAVDVLERWVMRFVVVVVVGVGGRL